MTEFERALSNLNSGNILEGQKILEKLIKSDGDNPDILFNLGMIYSDSGRIEEATNMLQKCIRISPLQVNAYVALAVAQARTKDIDTAIKNLKKALSIEPDNPYAQRNLGAIFLKKGDATTALFYLIQAFETKPDDPQTIYGLAQAYENLGDIENTDKYCQILLNSSAPDAIKEHAQKVRTKIAEKTFKKPGFRTDAMFYCLAALEKFEAMAFDEVKNISFEIALKGKNGLDMNDPDRKYTINTMKGDFTGLQLLCYMYVGFQKINPTMDIGIDLRNEYDNALQLFNFKKGKQD